MNEPKKHKRPEIRDAYSPRKPYLAKSGESKTHQAFKDECDIKNIVSRYARGEHIPEARGNPQYVENKQIDLHQAMNIQAEVNQAFQMANNPNERSNYGNNPLNWLEDLALKQKMYGESQTELTHEKAAASAGISGTNPVPPASGVSEGNAASPAPVHGADTRPPDAPARS